MNEFEISGVNESGSLVLTDSAEEGSIEATLRYSGILASWPVPFLPEDADAFALFFQKLVQRDVGQGATEEVTSFRGAEFVLKCWFQNDGEDYSDIWLYVTLASDYQDPYWRAEVRLILDSAALPELAERAIAFFARVKPQLAADWLEMG